MYQLIELSWEENRKEQFEEIREHFSNRWNGISRGGVIEKF